ncbi:MAG: extensin family protein [Pseudolabrys sp.]
MTRLLPIAVLLLAAGDGVAQGSIPLPRPRPPIELYLKYGPPAIFVPADHLTVEPSPCLIDVQKIAVVEPIALINGAEMCGSPDMVRLKAVKGTDGKQIEIAPPAELRCPMAASLAAWVREELPGAIGDELTRLVGYNSYECRPRNRIFGINVKLSEHAKGNALDIRAVVRRDGQVIDPTSLTEARPLREAIRKSACGRFSTVLGPGSDGHHEKHIHVDIAERRGNYKVCQWVVRDPPPMVAVSKAKIVASIPLPPPKPVIPAASGGR